MTAERKKCKEENKNLLQTKTEKVPNSVYGGCIGKAIEDS